MRTVIQRVSEASIRINGVQGPRIGAGLVVLVGIEEADAEEDAAWLAGKIARLRILADAGGQMNLALAETGGALLVVSQFTLHAATRKGNRPSFIRAARPETAIPLYERFIALLESETGRPVETGRFGADMKVALVNDGPVTIIMDTRNRE